jgi:Diacylglycerol kinase catalytic domain
MLAAMKRAVLIVNPFATRVTEEAIAAVERALMRVAYVRTVRTEGPRHAVALAREAGDADAVIVFSGDGGFNEALNGIERNDLPLGFVPGGGTSVLPGGLTTGASRSARGSESTRRSSGGSTTAAGLPTGRGREISPSSARSRACSSSTAAGSSRCSKSRASDVPRSSSSRT